MKNPRWKLFEKYVRNVLTRCGFSQVRPDKLVVYNGSAGRMINGIGGAHNADVLVEPPFQIPFTFPSRILIECKFHAPPNKKIGLPIMRNLLGLRQDVNILEIVDRAMLKKRKRSRSVPLNKNNFARYQYQVALATTSRVTIPAQEFALSHRIPIFIFGQSKRHAWLKEMLNYENMPQRKTKPKSEWPLLAVAEEGVMFFLFNESNTTFIPEKTEYEGRIHWSKDEHEWIIEIDEDKKRVTFYFEIPDRIFSSWAKHDFSKAKSADLKRQFFKDITVTGKTLDGRLIFFTIKLDKEWLKELSRKTEQKGRPMAPLDVLPSLYLQ